MAATIIVAGGQVVGDPSLYQAWDPYRLANPNALGDNQGCPPGWACIYVEDAVTGATARVCRLLDQSVLGPGAAGTIQQETAPNAWDQSIINVADASAAVVGGAGSVLSAVTPALGSAALIALAVLALVLIGRK